MKPGRELDALVAEKVMGWRIAKISRVDACYENPDLLEE